MPNCDCGATRDDENSAVAIHFPGCTSHDGEPDDPSDHYVH